MLKTFKNLLLQNQKADDLGTWYVALGMEGLPSLFKWWSSVDLDLLNFKRYINDLPEKVKTQVKLFADDTAGYLAITKPAESKQLLDDIDTLQELEIDLNMDFNPGKCQVIRITRSISPIPTQYSLHG